MAEKHSSGKGKKEQADRSCPQTHRQLPANNDSLWSGDIGILAPLEEIAEDLVHNTPDEEDHRALSDVIRFKQISEMGHR